MIDIDLRVLNDRLRAMLRETGRTLDASCLFTHGWHGPEYCLRIQWPDGHVATAGFGPEASALIGLLNPSGGTRH